MNNTNYSIEFSDTANSDILAIFTYISENLQTRSAANKLMMKIEKAVMQLCYFPHSGARMEFLRDDSKDYRKLVVDKYIIYYKVDDKASMLTVVRIFYSRQDYLNLL